MSNLARVLQDAYRHQGEQVAIIIVPAQGEDQPLTYRSLWEGAAGYAAALQAAGIEPGEVVVQILEHGAATPLAFFGAVLQGAVPSILPQLTEKLSPQVYRSSLAALIAVTRPAAIVTQRTFEQEVRRALLPGDSVRRVLIAEDISPQADPELEGWPGLQRAAHEITLLQHSSGTTGLQKGVALSHQAIFNQLASYGRAIDLRPDDVVVSWLPLYHDMGLIAGFLMPVLSKTRLVLMSPLDWVRAPARLLQAITRYRGTLSWLPNFAYNFCAQKLRDRHLEGVDLSSWRAAINCSEPVHLSSHQMFLERFAPYGFRASALAASYAMAENVFAVTQGGIDQPLALDQVDRQALQEGRTALPSQEGQESITLVSSGRAIDNTRIRIVDEAGQDLPERSLGEILIRSDCMLSGYYHRPEITREAFIDGWFRTGDIGYLVGEELFVTGRKKELIIVGGKNIYPQDLERLAETVSGVHPGRVVAFGVFNEKQGSEEVCLVAESDLASVEQRQRIENEIRQQVTSGSEIALRIVKAVDRGWLIKTSSGKTARNANRQKFLEEFLQPEPAEGS